MLAFIFHYCRYLFFLDKHFINSLRNSYTVFSSHSLKLPSHGFTPSPNLLISCPFLKFNNLLSQVYASFVLLVWGYSLEHGAFPRVVPLYKTDFSFPRRHQLFTICSMSVINGNLWIISSSVLEYAWLDYVQVLFASIEPVSLWLQQSCQAQKILLYSGLPWTLPLIISLSVATSSVMVSELVEGMI